MENQLDYYVVRGRYWPPDIPIIAAVDWSPPEIKKESEWRCFARYYFIENRENRIQKNAEYYASTVFK